MRVRVREKEEERDCVCERERERVCVCVCERERECVCVCVCVQKRKNKTVNMILPYKMAAALAETIYSYTYYTQHFIQHEHMRCIHTVHVHNTLAPLYLVLFLQFGNHDDGGAVEFPDHPPEVGQGGSGRPLGRYVLISTLISLQ